MLKLPKVKLSGKLLLPVIEGGKGIGVSNGFTAGAFAKAGAVGTFSGVNAVSYDVHGNVIPQVYNPKHSRREKFEQLIQYSVNGALSQAKIAYEIAGGNGAVHMNVLWEAGGAKRIIEEVLSKAKGIINGITCGAGLPYDLAELASRYQTYYYPIISSARAFRILWKRAYHRFSEYLGAVVYEDPWLAGGHTGLSNQEDPKIPEAPYERVVALRKYMQEVGLSETPIVMAGGVWALNEWKHFIDNPEIGNIAFQFGTRPLLTKESPISDTWKKLLATLKKTDILLHKYSPTGLYSMAVKNSFLKELVKRSERQVEVSKEKNDRFNVAISNNRGTASFYVQAEDAEKVNAWKQLGFDTILKTPDDTLIFVTREQATQIQKDQQNCMGCLSYCQFSNWCDKPNQNYTTGRPTDPRSFCIQKTLQNSLEGIDIDNTLLFSGSNGYRFSEDEFYKDGYIPTVAELVARICTGR